MKLVPRITSYLDMVEASLSSRCTSKSNFGFVENSDITKVKVPLAVVRKVPAFVAQFVFLALVLRMKGTRLLMAIQLVVPESNSATSGA